jgi:hypothetical protein
VPTLAEIGHVIGLMPTTTDTERRDQTLIAFIAITGARVPAVASFRLSHINIERRVVAQDARDVRTKFRKTLETWFFPMSKSSSKKGRSPRALKKFRLCEFDFAMASSKGEVWGCKQTIGGHTADPGPRSYAALPWHTAGKGAAH